MQQEAERVQEQQQQQQQEHAIKELMDSCPVRAGGAALGGYGLGLAFGLFLSSADWNASDKFLQMSTRDQIKHTFKDMAKRSHQGAKHWSLLGLVFSSTECVIESVI